MKENRLDKITDKLLLRVNRIVATAHKQYKSTNPYRMERVSTKEQIYDYSQLSNEEIEFGMQQFPQDTPQYVNRMEELLRRQNART